MIEVVTTTGEKFLAETCEQLVGLMWKGAFIEEAGPGVMGQGWGCHVGPQNVNQTSE